MSRMNRTLAGAHAVKLKDDVRRLARLSSAHENPLTLPDALRWAYAAEMKAQAQTTAELTERVREVRATVEARRTKMLAWDNLTTGADDSTLYNYFASASRIAANDTAMLNQLRLYGHLGLPDFDAELDLLTEVVTETQLLAVALQTSAAKEMRRFRWVLFDATDVLVAGGALAGCVALTDVLGAGALALAPFAAAFVVGSGVRRRLARSMNAVAFAEATRARA